MSLQTCMQPGVQCQYGPSPYVDGQQIGLPRLTYRSIHTATVHWRLLAARHLLSERKEPKIALWQGAKQKLAPVFEWHNSICGKVKCVKILIHIANDMLHNKKYVLWNAVSVPLSTDFLHALQICICRPMHVCMYCFKIYWCHFLWCGVVWCGAFLCK